MREIQEPGFSPVPTAREIKGELLVRESLRAHESHNRYGGERRDLGKISRRDEDTKKLC